jgi:hypothetical protein
MLYQFCGIKGCVLCFFDGKLLTEHLLWTKKYTSNLWSKISSNIQRLNSVYTNYSVKNYIIVFEYGTINTILFYIFHKIYFLTILKMYFSVNEIELLWDDYFSTGSKALKRWYHTMINITHIILCFNTLNVIC